MARKGENIYKRKDGRWEGRYIAERTRTGKAKYKSVYAKSYIQVKNKLQDAKARLPKEILNPDTTDSMKPFSRFLWEWLAFIRPRIKESSYVKYMNLIERHIDTGLGKLTLREVTTTEIDRFINELLLKTDGKDTVLSAKTVTDILGVTKNVVRYINGRYMRMNCDLNQIVIKREESQMRILSRQEQEKLISYLTDQPCLMNCGIFLTLFTGLRIGELCALRWQDINLEEKVLYVEKTMQRIQDKAIDGRLESKGNNRQKRKTKIIVTTPKSQRSIRKIPLPEIVIQVLRQYECQGNEYLLTGNENTYIEPRTLQYHFKKVLKKAQLEGANYHALRHTFATRCVELGFDIKSLSEILGHASVNITLNRYVHPSMELKRNNMEKLSLLIAVS